MRVYVVNDKDIQKLRDDIAMEVFTASFPLWSIVTKPNDLTPEQQSEWSNRWDNLIREAHKFFNHRVEVWLSDYVKND